MPKSSDREYKFGIIYSVGITTKLGVTTTFWTIPISLKIFKFVSRTSYGDKCLSLFWLSRFSILHLHLISMNCIIAITSHVSYILLVYCSLVCSWRHFLNNAFGFEMLVCIYIITKCNDVQVRSCYIYLSMWTSIIFSLEGS